MKIKEKVTNKFKKTLIITWLVMIFWLTQKINSQYYYYETPNTYQQWCAETLNVRINTEWKEVKAWRFHTILDPTKISYSNSSDYNTLRNNLFDASAQVFANRSSTSSPSRKSWSNYTILQVDLSNSVSTYNWNWGLYWTIKFTPLYNISPYSGSFGMEFNPINSWCDSTATIETTLSMDWCDTINVNNQLSYLTWTYNFAQEPCISDTNNPNINMLNPIDNAPKQTKLSWINLSLNEADWANWTNNVPYIRTWWIWTWNPWWIISNQYWIDLNSFSLNIQWNWEDKTFTWWSSWVTAIWNGKTRQDNIKSYNINIAPSELFDYWIEKVIIITTNVSDRIWRQANEKTITFNHPRAPRLHWQVSPNNWAIFVNLSAPIKFFIRDDRAWVNSGSIKVTLSWTNWTNYGPYIFSGIILNLSWVSSDANQPDYYINLTNHPDFPASWNIRMNIEAEDMAENRLSQNYNFSTRPSCSELQCCEVTIITKNEEIKYSQNMLYISWWSSPIFYTWIDWSWYVNCNSQNIWMKIYKWESINSWLATTLSSYYDNKEIVLSWRNWIKAILSGDTIYLSIINLFWYNLTWAILFSWRELETWTFVWPEDLDLTINNSFNTWIVMQSTWNAASTWVIEAYIESGTSIIQTWSTCTPIVIWHPIFTWKNYAEASLTNYNIYTTFKIWFTCLWSIAKFYNMSGNLKEIEIRVRDSSLITSWITKVRYSADLVNRNAMWTANVVNNVASFKTNLFAYFAIWNDKPTRENPPTTWCIWCGWGIKIIIDECPDGDFSPSYYDRDCWSEDSHNIVNYCWVWRTKYSQERVDAFQYAYWLWITTVCPIEDANLDWYILRKELAKMISEFAIKVIWLYPDFSKYECDRYRDIWKESEELQFYMKLSCRLWLMWLHTDWITVKSNFDPNDYVDRAQFGTIMSRLIFGWKYNWNEDNWYIDHLKALRKYKIMKYIDNPAMKELRAYVMIMMQRTDESWITRDIRSATDFINWARNLWDINLYNDSSQE